MNVRGAPAIAISAVLALAHQVYTEVFTEAELWPSQVPAAAKAEGDQLAALSPRKYAAEDVKTFCEVQNHRLDFLATSRPTAVNLFNAIRDFREYLATAESAESVPAAAAGLIQLAEALFVSDYQDNLRMGDHGADHILSIVSAPRVASSDGRKVLNGLTHCNTGTLATAFWGTALGVVRSLHKRGALGLLFADETRPYNQGARLTVTEAVADGIPTVLIADSAASCVMHGLCAKEVDALLAKFHGEGAVVEPENGAAAGFFGRKGIDFVVVGADRICRNGDTANKVGTLSVAVNAASAGVPFFVAAPWTTIDVKLPAGAAIPIEMRPASELTHSRGERVVVDDACLEVLNPSFDVVPSKLIAGIITERGVIVPRADGTYDLVEQA